MPNIKLTIEYDGSAYSGWQRQADRDTVQEEIERALERVLKVSTTLYGAGRTDAGVHALGQVANFHCESTVPPEKFAPALQQHLRRDILIKSSREATESFHSRFDAIARKYIYRLSPTRSALENLRRWEAPKHAELSLERLNEVAGVFRGERDCSALCIPASVPDSAMCDIRESVWVQDNDEFQFTIIANRFLHSMVRAIVGFCVKYASGPSQGNGGGRSPLTLRDIEDILKAGKWTSDHLIVPPQGLYLDEVRYPEE